MTQLSNRLFIATFLVMLPTCSFFNDSARAHKAPHPNASVAAALQAPTVKSLTIIFHTTADDKDWDTQVRDRIVIGGADVATLFCCSSDKNLDHWNNGETNAPKMNILKPIAKGDLNGASLILGATAHGNDTWIFVCSISVVYTDNTTDQWTFQEVTLRSLKGSYVEEVITIPPHP